MIEVQMAEKQFDFLKEKDKLFIIDFTKKTGRTGLYIRRRNRRWLLLGKVYAYLQEDERQIPKCGSPYLYERGWYRAAAVF